MHILMALVDGIKCSFSLTEEEYEVWNGQISKTVRTWVSVYEDTGELKSEEDDGKCRWRTDRNSNYDWYTIVRTAKFQTYDLEIRERHYHYLKTGKRKVTYRGELSGSITSNYHGGSNWQKLTFQQLQEELLNIERGLLITADRIKIDNLEPSITFPVWFPVGEFLNKNLVMYWGEPFNRYQKNSKGIALGRHLVLTDKTNVKAYDKSLEYSLPQFLMQFELHFKKMIVLNKIGIGCLADLKDWTKVNAMLKLLTNYFDRILIYDPALKKNMPGLKLNEFQKELIERGRAFEFWDDLKSDKKVSNGTYYNRLTEFKRLSKDEGENYHNRIKEAFVAEWQTLMIEESWKDLPSVKSSSPTPQLERFTGTVGSKYLQLLSNSNRNTKHTKEMQNTSTSSKSKKQLAKEKREQKEKQFKSFLNALGVTLQNAEKAKA